MFFRKKGRLRNEENERLLHAIETMKTRLDSERHFVAHGVDPSDDILTRIKMNDSIYSFLLREVRKQNVQKNKL
ncbi:YaaL family protein [Bacillus sp. FJAT-45037]|uniref:YaaL family protein n=1 Tax=Bacillus sp. FJAT-45037 TaxID=2011007 RepID=UPI000C233DEA|nr:YaaL family protein [Bacillus sp. FJAT-45037]